MELLLANKKNGGPPFLLICAELRVSDGRMGMMTSREKRAAAMMGNISRTTDLFILQQDIKGFLFFSPLKSSKHKERRNQDFS